MSIARVVTAALLLTGGLSPLFAAEPTYLDDRSSAAALVRSLYNAVSRKEYARAWDYFGEKKPAADFAAFVKGYETTAKVDVATGAAGAEGAAGSTFFAVPVAIRAVDAKGEESFFSGCFTARLANPAIQASPPFRPLALERGKLFPAAGPLEEAVPEQCDEGPAAEESDPLLDLAKAKFRAGYAEICQTLGVDAEPDAAGPDEYDIAFKYEPDGEERHVRLFRFGCITGAYNTTEVYYLADTADEVTQLQFAEPELDISYVNKDKQDKVESMRITGFTAQNQIGNSFYDDKTRTITSFAKWRGVGDASATGLYAFRDGRFVLVKFEADASYDEEINPETVLDYDTGP